LLDYKDAVAAVAAALNADQTEIGDPREGRPYAIAFQAATIKETIGLARNLARIGVTPRTTIRHDDFGNPALIRVVIHSKDDHAYLLKVTEAKLRPVRRQQLDDLVSAFAPISDQLLQWIWRHHQRGRSAASLADKLNQEGRIGGMGGKRWTTQKINKRIAEVKERWQPQAEAA
jgi:hypothetical protein